MKVYKLFLTLIIVFIGFKVQAQIMFNNIYDINSGSPDVSRGIIEMDDGYMIAGGVGGRIYTMKIDTLGEKKWVKLYNFNGWANSYFGFAGALIKTNDHNYVIAAQLKADTDYAESMLMKINNIGDTLWMKSYKINYPHYSAPSQCKQTVDKGYVICGMGYKATPINQYDSDFFLVKTDSTGNMQWHKTYGDDKTELCYSVIQLPDKGFLIGGLHYYSSSGSLHKDIKIIKTDSSGNQKWTKTFGNLSIDDVFGNLCLANDSNYILGFGYGKIQLNINAYKTVINILKLDTSGNIIWDKKYGDAYMTNDPLSIKALKNVGYIATGYLSKDDVTGYAPSMILKIKENGDSIWYREIFKKEGANCLNLLQDIIQSKDKGFVATGGVNQSVSGSTQDVWVIKTDSMGCLVPNCDVGIYEIATNKEILIYPNPAQNKVTVKIKENINNKPEKIILYNSLGTIIKTINYPQETTTIQLNELPEGVYIIRVLMEDGGNVAKMFVMVK